MSVIDKARAAAGPPMSFAADPPRPKPAEPANGGPAETKRQQVVYLRLAGGWVHGARNSPAAMRYLSGLRDPRIADAWLRHKRIVQLPARYWGDWFVSGLSRFLHNPIKSTISLLEYWPKAVTYLRARRGGLVSRARLDERIARCGKCDDLEHLIELNEATGGVKHSRFCGLCNCGHKARA